MEKRRGPGRPPNPEPTPHTARLDIRLTPALLRDVREVAGSRGESAGEWVRQLIASEVARCLVRPTTD